MISTPLPLSNIQFFLLIFVFECCIILCLPVKLFKIRAAFLHSATNNYNKKKGTRSDLHVYIKECN